MTDSGAGHIKAAWTNDDDLFGYAIQRREVCEYVADLFERNRELTERIHLIRFEDLYRAPKAEFARILEFADLSSDASVDELAEGIEASAHRCNMSVELRQQCWRIVEDAARRYGYTDSLEDIPPFSAILAQTSSSQ